MSTLSVTDHPQSQSQETTKPAQVVIEPQPASDAVSQIYQRFSNISALMLDSIGTMMSSNDAPMSNSPKKFAEMIGAEVLASTKLLDAVFPIEKPFPTNSDIDKDLVAAFSKLQNLEQELASHLEKLDSEMKDTEDLIQAHLESNKQLETEK